MCKYFLLNTLHAYVNGSHSVKFAFIERDNIFLMCILNFGFKFGLCVFIYSHLLKFPQNCFSQNFFFFLIFIGGEICS